MQATYYFEFKLDYFERYLVYSLQILPRPCGVAIEYFEKEPWQNWLAQLVNIDAPKATPINPNTDI